jgi:MFS family permease
MQWTAITLVTGAIALNYIDRSTLAVGNVLIRRDFGVSATEIGALQSAWSLTYAIFQVPVGFLLDRAGPRFLVGAALVLWSVAQGAGGLAVTYVQLLWSRVALGAAESPAFPSAVRVTCDWFQVRDRGRPTGLYNAGGNLGPAIAPPLLTGLMLAFGWRAMFIAMGAVGVLGALVWFWVYRNPHAAELSAQDNAYLADNRAAAGTVTAGQWARLFYFRSTWALMMLAFCAGYAIWMYQTWIPGYLEMQQHISIAQTGFLASVPLVCGIAGALSGGWFSDRLGVWGMSLIGSRKLPCIVGLLASGTFTALSTQASSGTEAVLLISLAMFFLSAGVAAKWTLITAVAPQSYCTSLAGLQNFGGYLGGTVSPIVTGYVVDVTGSFVIALAIGAAMTGLGALVLLVMLKDPIAADDLLPQPPPALAE